MVLRTSLFAAAIAVLFLACSSFERDNPYDKKASNTVIKKCDDVFNASTHFCYDGVIYALCSGIEYNPTAYYCEEPIVRAAKCEGKEYNPLIQRCQDKVVETACGAEWYDAANDGLRCEEGAIESKCGTNWRAVADANLRCQDNVVETKCGAYWYNAANVNLRCEGDAVETKCGAEWYNFELLPDNRCNSNVYETKCGNEWYNAANDGLRCIGDIVQTRCGTGSNYHNPEMQFCKGDDVLDKCGGETFDPATQRCQSGTLETKCGNNWYNFAVLPNNRCNNDVYETKCGEEWYNFAVLPNNRCENNIYETKCGTDWYNAANTAQYCSGSTVVSKMEFTDSRGNKKYKYVTIGTQTWMAENLSYETNGSVCYNNQSSNCTIYGRLYDWATAMTFESSCNSNSCLSQVNAKHQGICPSGWHIPSQTEWNLLINYVENERGCSSCAGKYLKAASGWNNDGNGQDTYGFAALPGGGNSNSSFYGVGGISHWLSSTENSPNYVYLISMYYSSDYAYIGADEKSYLLSIRCVKD